MILDKRSAERAAWLVDNGYAVLVRNGERVTSSTVFAGSPVNDDDLYWTVDGLKLLMGSDRELIDYKYGKNAPVLDVIYGLAHNGALTKPDDVFGNASKR